MSEIKNLENQTLGEVSAETVAVGDDIKAIGAIPMIAMKGKVVFPNVYTTFDVGRAKSLAALNYASVNGTNVFVATQKESAYDDPTPEDIYETGVICNVKRSINIVGDNVRVHIEGLYRAKIVKYVKTDEFFAVCVEKTLPVYDDDIETQALFDVTRQKYKEYVLNDKTGSQEVANNILALSDPDVFANVAAFNSSLKEKDKQRVLETVSVKERLEILAGLLSAALEIAEVEKRVSDRVRKSVEKGQKEYYLREQLKAIHQELGDDESEIFELEKAIKAKNMPKESEEKVLKELSRMSKMSSSSPDYTVLRTYIDWIIDLPFSEETLDTSDLKQAEKVLNADHFGLEKVKSRIVEYLAVLKLTKKINGSILCLVGPPGVGKTSVASSVARALGRKFVRMSLGGVKDEAEIRGHRKTYIGAMPGRIIYGIKQAGTINPVFLLDEIDKISSDLRGDPASALLEVLDPEQNVDFRDRYLEIPYDLSKVLFITTANSLETIPAPLLDRMEIIELNGYTEEEKVQIASRYLVPKKLKENGLNENGVTFSESGIKAIIEGYTREAGVRNLEREIGGVCRKIACKVAESESKNLKTDVKGENAESEKTAEKSTEKTAEKSLEKGAKNEKRAEKTKKYAVTAKNVEKYLGAKKFLGDDEVYESEVGSATGLAWTAVGGTTLTIEVGLMRGKGEILLTGKLGDVMKESARAAISYIHANAEKFGIDESLFEKRDIHVHVPEGATPKDGPSAGITMATALFSAFTGKKVNKKIAMTGEITLRGKVLPIGGLKEKALAAYRVGIKTIIIPEANVKDLEEIPAYIRAKMTFIPVKEVSEVFDKAIEGFSEKVG